MRGSPAHGRQTMTLGSRRFGPFVRPVRIPLEHFWTHIRVTGKSGFGKSNVLCSLYLALLEQGYGVTLIDPHGDLAELLLRHLIARGYFRQPDAFERLWYLDIPAAAKQGRYLPMNVLEQRDSQGHPIPSSDVARAIKEAAHRAYPELREGAATFNKLLTNAIRVLIVNRLPLTALDRFMIDKPFRLALLANEPDEQVVRVFTHWFDRFSLREQAQIATSLLNRTDDLTSSDFLKGTLGAAHNVMNFRAFFRAGVSSIINLNLENREEAQLIACLLTVFAEVAAQSRSKDDQESGPQYLMIDEYNTVSARNPDTLDAFLSQCRKRGCFVIPAYQTEHQLRERSQGSLQNIGMDILLRSGRADARLRADALGMVDPLSIKHEVEDEAMQERSHPAYYQLTEQVELMAQRFQGLWRGEACITYDNPTPDRFPLSLIRRSDPRTVLWLKTTAMDPAPPVEPGELAEVQRTYLSRYFRPPAPTSVQDTPARQLPLRRREPA